MPHRSPEKLERPCLEEFALLLNSPVDDIGNDGPVRLTKARFDPFAEAGAVGFRSLAT